MDGAVGWASTRAAAQPCHRAASRTPHRQSEGAECSRSMTCTNATERSSRWMAAPSPSGPAACSGSSGRNGAGKTTTMRAVFGLLLLDAGEVRWEGHAVDRRRPGPLRLHAGGAWAVPQDAGAATAGLPGTAPRHEPVRGADGGRTAAGRPGPCRTGPASKVEDLSQGNQQRVQLAAALIHDPRGAGAGRAVQRAGPDRGRDDGRVLRERAAAGAAVVSPPTSWTSSRTCARTSPSSTAAVSC